MLEQRNLVLAIVLSIAIILGFEILSPKPEPIPEEATTTGTTGSTGVTASGATSSGVPGSGVSADGVPTPGTGNASVPGSKALAEARTEVVSKAPRIPFDNGRIHGSISLVGARIDDLTLGGYRETVDPTSAEIVLLSPAGAANPYYADFGWTTAPGAAIKVPTPSTKWQARSGTLTQETPVLLTWDNGQGLVFTRTISLDENFLFTIEDFQF